MSNDLPPGCNVSDIPGNTKQDADWDNACEIATAICKTVDVGLLYNPNFEGSTLNETVSEKLVEAIARGLLVAHENGYEKGLIDAKRLAYE